MAMAMYARNAESLRQVSRMDRKEAINALKLINLKSVHPFLSWEEMLEVRNMAIAALQEPERKKGRWEDFDYDNSYRCTACGEIWTLNDGTPEENNMNYCSFCGADMRGEEK